VIARRLLVLALIGALVALAGHASAADDEDEEDLQQRLTEREDKRRPLEPFSVDLGGHLLTLGGELELELDGVRRRVLEDVAEPDQLRLSNQLELEAFYTVGKPFSVFAQIAGVLEDDLLGGSMDAVSDRYVEREEMWIYSEDMLGSGLSIDLGRLNFEDDRRWWWDADLDAARVEWEHGGFDVALAVGQELASNRSDQSFVDPEQERVLRMLMEGTWDFHENHSFQLFLLHQQDGSRHERLGELVAVDHQDESDATLTWLGLRQTGIFTLAPNSYLGYWLDSGLVRGHERLLSFSDPANGRVEVEDVSHGSVRGWALDVGLSWLLPLPCEPRLFGGYAFGSGGDGGYRQSGIQVNEAGFGGVERFDSYGLLLRPELSNLHILTLGAGVSLLRSSSLDLVYHYYRLDRPATALRDSRLDFELDGRHKDLGHAVDLFLAVEEWERFEFDVAASLLRTSNSFVEGGSSWVVGGFVAVRYAF
jgi:alginate production protein